MNGTPTGTSGRLTAAELRRRAVDRLIDAGAEVTEVSVREGETGTELWISGRVGFRSEIGLLRRKLRDIPGVTRIGLVFEHAVDDTAAAQTGTDS